MDPAKIQTILEWTTPRAVSDIWSFLGMASYYRRFIQDFRFIAIPMTKLTRKNVKFIWDEKCEQSFEMLKMRLTTSLVSTLLDGNDCFVIIVMHLSHDWLCTNAT